MNNQIKITFNDGDEETYEEGVSLLELSKYYQSKMDNPIIGAKINNLVLPLDTKIKSNSEVYFFDVNDINGQAMYLSALKFILVVAIKELYGKESDIHFLNSLGSSLYSELVISEKINDKTISDIKTMVEKLVQMDLPFEKINISKKEAVNFLKRVDDVEKAKNIQNLPNSLVVLYKLKSYYNYFYTDMPYSTKVINKFDLQIIDDNHIIVKYPTARSNNVIPEYEHFSKTLSTFDRYRAWLNSVGTIYVSQVNDIVSKNAISEYIQMNKIVLDRQLDRLTDEIVSRKHEIKLVCIAGPSSSGKTTSALRVSLQLKSIGLNPIVISVDNYFKERTDTPKDENGDYDFESLDAIDLDLFNSDLKKLCDGEEVSVPKFNFYTGKKEWNGNTLKLKNNDIIILEGLHCLNPEFASSIPSNEKYKIYVSPFMAVRIDKHNHISTVDLRLLRRIVRDSVYRGHLVSDTIKHWQKVRRGEEKYIFPYQNDADIILNTASAYEIGVLKVYAEPLLYSVAVNSPFYEEARRLLGYLRIYYPIPSEYVPVDAVLREFIGGSMFNPH